MSKSVNEPTFEAVLSVVFVATMAASHVAVCAKVVTRVFG